MAVSGFWNACANMAPKVRIIFDNIWKILRWMLLSATGWASVEAAGWSIATASIAIVPGTVGAFLVGVEVFSWLAGGVTEKGRATTMVGTVLIATAAFFISMYFGTAFYLMVVGAALQSF